MRFLFVFFLVSLNSFAECPGGKCFSQGSSDRLSGLEQALSSNLKGKIISADKIAEKQKQREKLEASLSSLQGEEAEKAKSDIKELKDDEKKAQAQWLAYDKAFIDTSNQIEAIKSGGGGGGGCASGTCGGGAGGSGGGAGGGSGSSLPLAMAAGMGGGNKSSGGGGGNDNGNSKQHSDDFKIPTMPELAKVDTSSFASAITASSSSSSDKSNISDQVSGIISQAIASKASPTDSEADTAFQENIANSIAASSKATRAFTDVLAVKTNTNSIIDKLKN